MKRPALESPSRRSGFLPVALGISGGVALAAVGFWLFRRQARHVKYGRAQSFDEKLLEVVHRHEGPEIAAVMRVVTWMGTHPAVGTCAVATAFALAKKGRPGDARTLVISTAGMMALERILKHLFARKRPQHIVRHIALPRSSSFPSGHSMMTAATFPIVAHYLVSGRSIPLRLVGHGAAGIVVATVGFSRIYFGVHYPSDVLAGFAAGLGWLGVTSMTHVLTHRV